MEYLFIYGLQLSDYLKALAIIMLIIPVLIAWFFCVANVDSDTIGEYWDKWFKRTLIACIVIPLILFALPTERTLLLIGGTYLAKKAINEVVQSDKMKKINTIIDLQIDKYIKELQET